ncbi:MAG TPA: hypothetical protein VJ720_11405, partial [Chitinophaga sp.]|nr:hypothetical protein [Chitinophaga sp.]
MNFELKKIKWAPGKAATQLQLMTLRVRRKSDEDEAINYTLIADEMQVYTDGTILNPPVIKNLEEDTTYIFRISNNDPAGGQFDMVYTTPREMETAEITKAYYHNSELICDNSTGFLDATLPPKIGGYYGLEYSLADWFGYNPNITLVGEPVWK